ncbi:MAG: hypothetical protein EXX96DRAFT_604894 [Benjaminiella poitrasii]|nr:MAG: hypothetical protein EXX96DRAFT_604894 [Benjaminiella poitrasii]
MYFTLPKSQDRQPLRKTLNKKASNSSLISTESNTSTMAEDRISEIIHNLDDHWGSPPILTPDTLSHILNHQWIINDDTIKQQDIKKVSKAAATVATVAANRVIKQNNRALSTLIEEFCKTIERIDPENTFEVAKDIKSDPLIQKFIISSKDEDKIANGKSEETVIQHVIELLQYHNSNSIMQDDRHIV